MFNPNPMQWYKQYNLNKSHSLFGFKCDMYIILDKVFYDLFMFGFFHIDSRWSLDSGCSIIVVKIHTYSSVDWFISFWQNSKLHFPSLLDSDCLNWIRITKKHMKLEVILVNINNEWFRVCTICILYFFNINLFDFIYEF